MLDKTEITHGNQPEGGGKQKDGKRKGGKQQPNLLRRMMAVIERTLSSASIVAS